MHVGNFSLALHTHLPWVLHHGTAPHGVDWLNEAVAECYIPLMNVFNDLLNEEIPAKVTIDISPVLCEQLAHPDLVEIFENYCKAKIAAAEKDEKNFREWGWDPHHVYLAEYWRNWYSQRLNDFTRRYDKSVIGGLRKLQDEGAIEIATCGATHGYLPLLGTDRSVNFQVEAAVKNYKKHFGRAPRGIWLPECAYRPSYEWKTLLPIDPFDKPRLRPGIEQFLARHGLNYFFVDQPLVEQADPLGVYLDKDKEKFAAIGEDPYDFSKHPFYKSPLNLFHVSSSKKVEYGTAIAFARHKDIAMQVWSGEIGYPGEPDYLDFHKKYLDSGLRYWRVTDNKADMMYKTLYRPDWTQDKIDKQANHFIHQIENTLNWWNKEYRQFGTLCAPFDTELFGHWWFEGPEFIRAVIKGLHNSPYCNTATASEQIFRTQPREVMSIPEGSWGENNNHDVWSNEGNKWTWRAIYDDENRLKKIFEKFPKLNRSETAERLLKQILRETALLHSSDWQFLIYTESAKDYAEQRFSFHHSDFNRLCDIADNMEPEDELKPDDEKFLSDCEQRNSIFEEIELEMWSDIF